MIVDNLSYKYRYGVSAINNVCFSVENEIVAVVGEKESGKSTLTGLLAGVIEGYSGNISLISDLPTRDAIAYVPDRDCLFKSKSVYYNLAYPLIIRKTARNIIEERVEELAKKFSIDGLLSERIDSLSESDKVKVAYARAFLRDTEFLLLDDYYSDLEDSAREEIISILKRSLKSYKKTVLFSTERLDDAMKITDKILVLRYGYMSTFGSINDKEWFSDVYCSQLAGDEILKGRLKVNNDDLYLITEDNEIKLDKARLKSSVFIGEKVLYSSTRDILFDADSDKAIYF